MENYQLCIHTVPLNFMPRALGSEAGFRLGLARTLSPAAVAGPTPFRALRRLVRARHGITIDSRP